MATWCIILHVFYYFLVLEFSVSLDGTWNQLVDERLFLESSPH